MTHADYYETSARLDRMDKASHYLICSTCKEEVCTEPDCQWCYDQTGEVLQGEVYCHWC